MAEEIDVDTGRLGDLAGTLGSQTSWLSQARSELESGVTSGQGSCGSIDDGGLRAALQRLSEAWGFDVEATGGDIASVAAVMKALSQLYSQVDAGGAQALGE